MVLAALARSTQAGGIAAYVDTTDCLEPRSAEQAGVFLDRLLGILCGAEAGARRDRGERRLSRMDEAWQTAKTLEDKRGVSNLILAPQVFPAHRLVGMHETFLLAERILQNTDGTAAVNTEVVKSLRSPALGIESYDFH